MKDHDRDYDRFRLQEVNLASLNQADHLDDDPEKQTDAAYDDLKAEVEAILSRLEQKHSDRRPKNNYLLNHSEPMMTQWTR